jgi:hypothetical protein
MPHKCVVCNQIKTADYSLFAFPQSTDASYNIWCERLGLRQTEISVMKCVYVCSFHFAATDVLTTKDGGKVIRRQLRIGAIPTGFFYF